MSTSATSKSAPRDSASAFPVTSWGPLHINFINNVKANPAEPPLTGAIFFVDPNMTQVDQQHDEVIIIGGNMTPATGENAAGAEIPFVGHVDSGRFISFVVEFKEVTYKFEGLVSTSFTSMAGLVTMSVQGAHADDEATWSSQARGGGETDHPGGGKGASKKGRK